MIEAVNSVLSSAPVQRGNAEQSSSAGAAQRAVEAPKSSAEAPVAPYISPFIEVDRNFNKAVIQIRDSDTGDVVRQFPSESALKARQSADQVSQSAESARASISETTSSGSEAGETSGGSTETAGIEASSVNVAQAQQASAALNASAQTSQIAQATISVTA